MGNKLPKDNVSLKNIMDRFEIVQEIPEQNITFLEEKDSKKEFILKEITFNDKN